MSDPTSSPDKTSGAATFEEKTSPARRFWLKELSYVVVLILTLLGVAFSSISRQPIIGYWEILVPIVGIACIGTGWQHAHNRKARMRLILTQALHWGAFLAAMNMLLLSNVQRMLNSDATGLAIMLLLALGTLIAGIHIFSWEICLLGLVMALCVPAIAWIEQSALVLFLGAIVLLGVGFLFWRSGGRGRTADL